MLLPLHPNGTTSAVSSRVRYLRYRLLEKNVGVSSEVVHHRLERFGNVNRKAITATPIRRYTLDSVELSQSDVMAAPRSAKYSTILPGIAPLISGSFTSAAH